MTQQINYNHLLYFKTIVEQGSIAKASQVLRIGAPAISMQLKTLEEQIQKKLFHRNKRQLILTDTGTMVFQYAKEIFGLGNELMTTLNDQSYGPIKIQIGVQDSLPKNLLSQVTNYIYDNFESLVSVYNGENEQMTLDTARHKFDLAILNSPPIISDKTILLSKRIKRSQVVLAASPRFIELKGKPLSQFNNQPFILPASNNNLRHKLELYFSQNDLSFRLVGETTETVNQKYMAIGGDGIIAIMKDALPAYIKAGQLIVLKELPNLYDEVWLVMGKRTIPNPIAHKIMAQFKFKT